MPRWLKFTGIGCGGLVVLFILLAIVGSIIGGGETATEQPVSESASEQAKAGDAKERESEAAQREADKQVADAQREAEAAKEEAAQAKREAEEAKDAQAEAESAAEEEPAPVEPAPEEEPAPASDESGGGGTAIIRVTGAAGEGFTGSYGNIDTTRSVDGTVPAEYEVKVDTGFMSFDSVTAVMQKAGAGAGELGVEIVVDGEVVKKTNTTAEYGVATVSWSPSE